MPKSRSFNGQEGVATSNFCWIRCPVRETSGNDGGGRHCSSAWALSTLRLEAFERERESCQARYAGERGA